MDLEKADKCMTQGLEEQIFTGAVLLVARRKEKIFSRAYGALGDRDAIAATEKTLFDLASLTKVLATTPAWIILASSCPEILDQRISEWFPSVPSDKEKITPRHLLAHISGLPAWRPYYLSGHNKSIIELATNKVLNEPLEYPTGQVALYSDLGFILLAAIVELESREAFDSFCRKRIFEPLAISQDLMFNPIGEESRTALTRPGELPGQVNDLNARALGGVSGHAGLFGAASAVAAVAAEILAALKSESTLLGSEITRTFCQKVTSVPGCSRALGFDTPSEEGSSSGRFFSSHSVGHAGFTGTSLWIDIERELTVVLLTNRVFMGESDFRIKAFRPAVHDAIMEEILALA
jgi:CubicO group peptidase (beta-lactamase class C family)